MVKYNSMQNPYTSRNMIKALDAFFGRRSELEEIFTNLNQGFQNTSILGERRFGKSSLLWCISQPEVYQQYALDGDNPFLFIFFDLQRVAGLTQKAFFKLLSKSLVCQLPQEHILGFEDFDTCQEYFSELVQEACMDFRIVICIAGCHPLFLQIACFNLFDLKKKKREAGEKEELYQVEQNQLLDDFVMAASPHFDQVWKRLSPLEKKILANSPTITPGGEHKHTISNLIKRGLLLAGRSLQGVFD